MNNAQWTAEPRFNSFDDAISVHVCPRFGSDHQLDRDGSCWCEPELDNPNQVVTGGAPLWIHRPSQ